MDMNLSPEWLGPLTQRGIEAVHWSTVGSHNATDASLLAWAREHSSVVLTQDLDFSQLLVLTQTNGPSVVLLRLADEIDPALRDHIRGTIQANTPVLDAGALIVISKSRVRPRRLPIVRP